MQQKNLRPKRRQKRKNKIVCGIKYCRMYLQNRKGDVVGTVIYDKKNCTKIRTYQWRKDSGGYCGNERIRLHQFILGKKEGFIIDHINRDKLDNREKNLRFVTRTENAWNRKCAGVHKHSKINLWVVQIVAEGKRLHIGCYKTKKEALEVRRATEIKYYKGIKYVKNHTKSKTIQRRSNSRKKGRSLRA